MIKHIQLLGIALMISTLALANSGGTKTPLIFNNSENKNILEAPNEMLNLLDGGNAMNATNITCTSFTANWTANSNATAYLLDVSTDPNFGSFLPGYSAKSVTGTSASVTGLNNNSTYFYRISISSASCGIGTTSAVVTVTTIGPSVPVAGSNTASSTQIVWNWGAVSGATGYKYNTRNSYATASDNGASTTYTQTGSIPCGVIDSLWVWAYSAACPSTPLLMTAVYGPVSTFTSSGTWTATPITFTPTTLSGATYSWTFASGSITSSTVQNPSVTWASAGTYNVSLSVTVGGCTGTSITALAVRAPIIQSFTSSTTWTCPAGVTTIAALVVGGGGAGGEYSTTNSNGGGGGGGVVENMSFPVTPGTVYTVTVGAGGAHLGTCANSVGANGSNSVFGTLTALGGGGGGYYSGAGQNGGSGGGGAYSNNTKGLALQPSSASGGYGNNGGMSNNYTWTGGGGGGAGGIGHNGDECGNCSPSGNGGIGYLSQITGLKYAGGGGGGDNSSERSGSGFDGGGRGMGQTLYESYTSYTCGLNTTTNGSSCPDGIANTGGGGGAGTYWNCGSYWGYGNGQGGSGIVVIKY